MAKIRLLIADDHQLLLDGLISMLQTEKDFEISGTACNGYEVLSLAENNTYDICLMDINMPRMDGIDAAKLMKQRNPEIKIIILTTYNDKEIINEILQEGICGYLLKNSSKLELIAAIRKVAAGGMYFSDEVHEKIMQGYTKMKSKEEPVVFTPREIDILQLLVKEYNNEKIAEILNISYRTVETHRKNMMHKTKSHNIAGLLKFAYTNGLIK
jgi:DNA-binding NarL/FixJ family response regulator